MSDFDRVALCRACDIVMALAGTRGVCCRVGDGYPTLGRARLCGFTGNGNILSLLTRRDLEEISCLRDLYDERLFLYPL